MGDSDSSRTSDYVATPSGASSPEDQVTKGYGSGMAVQSQTIKEPPGTRVRQARLNGQRDDGATTGLNSAPSSVPQSKALTGSLSLQSNPSESSNTAATRSEVANGKRPANDTIDDDRSSKRIHSVGANSVIDSSTVARSTPTLTLYKQEHTFLKFTLPGSTSDVVIITFRSAMTMSTFFTSVSNSQKHTTSIRQIEQSQRVD